CSTAKTASRGPPRRLTTSVARPMNCCADVPTRRSTPLTGMPSVLSRAGKISVNTSIGSTVLYCKSRLVTSSKVDIQCRLMSFRGSRDGPGPPKLQLVASGKVERSLPIKLTSARLRQGLLTPGQRRALVNTDTAGGEEADSYPPRSAKNVPRPISPRVPRLPARDVNADVTGDQP